ncbi:MAG: hypothetical protein GX595_10025, partial [Lentisphaerae bacterium]|nr:hypothetical protein [Lentisphaerota bacterium]
GQAVRLSPETAPVSVRLALPAGVYSLRLRSRAVQQDTYSELLPQAAGVDLRPQPVTNDLFTWQRSHLTHAQDGEVEIRLACREGAGMLLDAIRIERTGLNEPIGRLKDFPRDTVLVRDGAARCLIAAGDGGRYRDQAAALAAELKRRGGVDIAVRDAETIDEVDLRSLQVIALGAAASNIAMLKARPGGWGVVPAPPEDGTPMVYVAVDVRGTGANVVMLGGADEAQVQASVEAFLAHLQAEPVLHLPWVHLPPPAVHDRDAFRERAVASGKLLRQGAIRLILRDAKYYDDAAFSMYMHRYWEYLDSADVLARSSYHGALDMEFHKLLPQFEHREQNPTFSPAEHLALTHLMWNLNELNAGLFAKWWGLLEAADADDMTRLIRERAPAITWNHQTFPALGLLFGADYFGRHYDLRVAHQRRQWVETLMHGQFVAAKPMCDCWGYQDITIAHTAYLASLLGRWDYYERYPLHQFLRLRLAVHDNLGAGVGYGDVGGYSAPVEGDPRDSMSSLASVTGGRIDLRRVTPEEVEGLYVHPVEPLWYAQFGGRSSTPLGKAFDKITMRQSHDPRRAYLLLDGLSGSNHGHWDGNTILRFTANGRMWLCEGDYLKGDMKEHNGLTLTRDARTAEPDRIVALREQYLDDEWGLVITRTADYAGTDWDRHLLWHRPSDTFLMQDRVTARLPGHIDASVRFRSLGTARLEGCVWQVEQEGAERFTLHAPGSGRILTGTAPEDAKNWSGYPYAEPTPQLLRHRQSRALASGESMLFSHVFYATGPEAPRGLQAQALEGAGVVTTGDLEAVVLAGPEVAVGDVVLRAAQAILTPTRPLLVSLQRLECPGLLLTASSPVTLSIDVAARRAATRAEAMTTLMVTCGDVQRRYRIAAGEGALDELPQELLGSLERLRQALVAESAAVTAAGPASAASAAHHVMAQAQVALAAPATSLALARFGQPPIRHALVGGADGTLAAVREDGSIAWQQRFGGRVNAIAAGDLDGDGQEEVAIGVEDSHLYLLNADGSTRWKRFFEAYRASGGIEGHPRVVMMADFEGDGTLEVAVGCANSTFYVLDAAGEPKRSATGPWTVVTQHKACGIGAADMTGDGLLELLCGYTYQGRMMADFSRSGYDRFSTLTGTHGGSAAITAADFDGDGRAEAVFADRAGKVTMAKPYVKQRGPATIVWQTYLGDDAHTRALAADLAGDGQPKLVLASDSGFIAVLDAEGEMLWIRHADDAVSDAAVLSGGGRPSLVLRSSYDGTVAAYGHDGAPRALWRTDSPVLRIAAVRAEASDLAWALEEYRLTLLKIAGD